MSTPIKISEGNYFESRNYLNWDIKTGVLRARDGSRIMSFPQCFAVGLLEGLEEECGQAWSVVLYSCGRWWGKRQMKRFEKALGEFYGQSLAELPTAEVHASIVEAFATEGWGRVKIDVAQAAAGFIRVTLKDSPLTGAFQDSQIKDKNDFVDYLFAGALAGMFSHAANANLAAFEVACTAHGDQQCEFIIGLDEKLSEVPNLIRQGLSATKIYEQIFQ